MDEKFSSNEIINEVYDNLDNFGKDIVNQIISEYETGTPQGITTDELKEYTIRALKHGKRKD